MKVGIFQIDKGFALWKWLCQLHLDARRAAGWVVKERKSPPFEIPCDDCWWEEQDGAGF